MKRAILVALAVATLAGCSKPAPTLKDKTDPTFKVVEKVVNAKEREMINYWLADADGSNYLYKETWRALATRNKYGESAVRRDDSKIPFCDVIAAIGKSEEGIRNTYERTFNNQWRSQYGISLNEQCGYVKPESLDEAAARIEELELKADLVRREAEAQSTQIKTLNDVNDATVELLDPHEYDYLIESARDCNRAKTKLLTLTQARKPLTQADGSDARKLIIECKMHQLEVELNK